MTTTAEAAIETPLPRLKLLAVNILAGLAQVDRVQKVRRWLWDRGVPGRAYVRERHVF